MISIFPLKPHTAFKSMFCLCHSLPMGVMWTVENSLELHWLGQGNDIWINNFCGLYYKHITIVNDDCRVVRKWCSKLLSQAWLRTLAKAKTRDNKTFIVQASLTIIKIFLIVQSGNTKGEVSLYHWPPVWLVWINVCREIGWLFSFVYMFGWVARQCC